VTEDGEVVMKKAIMVLVVIAGIGLSIALVMRRRSGDDLA
jgi:hypothetical protein